MSFKRDLLYFCLCAWMTVGAVEAFSQTKQPTTWAEDIAFMEKMTPTEVAAQQATILQIRVEVEAWITAHPGGTVSLSPLPTLPLGTGQASAQLLELRKAVAEILQQDPSHPFHLGVTEVEVSTALSPLSPTLNVRLHCLLHRGPIRTSLALAGEVK